MPRMPDSQIDALMEKARYHKSHRLTVPLDEYLGLTPDQLIHFMLSWFYRDREAAHV